MTTLTFPPDAPVEATTLSTAPKLRWKKRGQPAQSIELGAGKWTIGSSPRCNVCLPDAEVRPLQCLLTLEGDVATVTRWAAGVLLNGQEFRTAPLRSGDRFSVGGWEIEVQGVRGLRGPEVVASPPMLEPPPLERPVLPRGAETETPGNAWEPVKEREAPEPAESDSASSAAKSCLPAAPTPTPALRPCFASQAFEDSLIVELWRSHDKARTRCRSLVQALRTTRCESKQISASLAAAQNDLEAAERDLETARAAQRASAAALTAARLTVPVKSSDTRPLETIQNARLKAAEDRAAALSAEVAELASRRQSLEEELAAKTAESTRLVEQLAAANAENERLGAQVAAAEENRSELEAELARRSRSLEEREQNFAEQLAEASKEKAQLAAQITAEQESRSRLEAELTGQNESLDQHEKRYAEQLAEAKQLQEQLEARVAAEQENRSRLEVELTDRSELLDQHEKRHAAELADAAELQQQLEAQIAAEQESRSLLEAELVDRGRSVAERDRRVAEVEAELADHNQRLAEYEGQLAERARQLTEIQAELDRVRTELVETQAASARLAEEAKSAARLTWAVPPATTPEPSEEGAEGRVSHQPPTDPLSLGVGAAWPAFPEAATSFHQSGADDLAPRAEDRLPSWDFSAAATWGASHGEPAAETAAAPASNGESQAEETFTPVAEEVKGVAGAADAAQAEDPQAVEEPLATTPEEVTFEAPKESTSASFIEQYRHLLEGRDSAENSLASEPLLDEEFQSTRQPTPAPAAPHGDADDALEDYMAQLMNRVRGGGASGHVGPASEDSPSWRIANPAVEPVAAVVEEPTHAPKLPGQPGVIDLAELRRKARKMPEAVDLSAMRDLANQSAHGAISAHRERRHAEIAYTRFALCGIASVAAMALMMGAPSFESPRYVAGLACGIGGLGAAFQLLRVARTQRADRKELSQLTKPAAATPAAEVAE